MQQAQVATIAALANAALKFKCLEDLCITGAPDIWESPTAAAAVPAAATAVPAAGSATPAQAAAGAFLLDETDGSTVSSPYAGIVASLAPAATAFSKMEEVGCWLLHHHPKLMHVDITVVSGWGMSWGRSTGQQEQQTNSSASQQCIEEAAVRMQPARSSISQIKWQIFSAHYAAQQASNKGYDADSRETPAADRNADFDGTKQSLVADYTRWLSCYISRPAEAVWCHMTGCMLEVQYDQISDLADLLVKMQLLKTLEVRAGAA